MNEEAIIVQSMKAAVENCLQNRQLQLVLTAFSRQ